MPRRLTPRPVVVIVGIFAARRSGDYFRADIGQGSFQAARSGSSPMKISVAFDSDDVRGRRRACHTITRPEFDAARHAVQERAGKTP